MVSATDDGSLSTLAGLETNTLADGLFHLGAFAVTAVAVWLLIRDAVAGTRRAARPRSSWRQVSGCLLLGWGAFNVVEGLVDHHLLRVHHVRDDVASPTPWDLGFLVLSAGLGAVGWFLARRIEPDVGAMRRGDADRGDSGAR